jgi:hypothetical protein
LSRPIDGKHFHDDQPDTQRRAETTIRTVAAAIEGATDKTTHERLAELIDDLEKKRTQEEK